MKTCLWAPRAQKVELIFEPDGERAELHRVGEHFHLEHPRIAPGQCYRYSLDGGPPRPDPRSASQPEGVHGPSQWIDFESFVWTDQQFQQCPLGSAVLYELHVGTFSEPGTFRGVIAHLDHLRALGVTHIELMPIAQFPGERGWGYDGVDLFAPHTGYGGPRGLMELVDACHAHGLAVILDVVYNHLGPSGNYLAEFGPYFTDRYKTPWGEALNFDGAGSDEVRRFVCDNALHWLKHYHIDALRLDAVHAIFDQSARHILAQLKCEVERLSLELGRHLYVIAESALNDPRIIRCPEQGGYGLDSQWNDDFHHALRTVLTGDRSGYYVDFGELSQVGEALTSGFVYHGQYSPFRGRSFGAPLGDIAGHKLVAFSQNHDQVGNRALGERPSAHLSLGQLKLAAAFTLLGPFVPMLFMGEEWGTKTPFQYFVDHSEPELREAVKKGRQNEFVSFGWRPDEVPDPGDPATFARSKLDFSEGNSPKARELLHFYRRLVALRRGHPALAHDQLNAGKVEVDEARGTLLYARGSLRVLANFSPEAQQFSSRLGLAGQVILSSTDFAVNGGTKVQDLVDGSLELPPESLVVIQAPSS